MKLEITQPIRGINKIYLRKIDLCDKILAQNGGTITGPSVFNSLPCTFGRALASGTTTLPGPWPF